LWIYDWASNSEHESSFDEEIDWEIEPVQRWVKGEKLLLEHIQDQSEFIGFASAYPAREIFHFLG
jgi:hypothetical protein